jgi:glycosyltransferase involved in cell wall biosynthesis
VNVLLLDQYSDPGGAQQVLLELLPAIRERGWRAVVGLPGSGKLCDAIRVLGIAVERIDCASDARRYVAQTPRLARQIRELADRVAADLVYVNGPRVVPAAALAGVKCPVVFHSHSWLPAGIARTAAGVALRKMDARVVANCEFVAAQWRRFVRVDRISVVLNGVAGTGKVRRSDGTLRIGCIGRISPEKGQREFVAAAARIREALPECRFVVCGEALFGSADAQRYAAEVRRAAAGLPIEFRGWVGNVYDVLAELDLLLVPSNGPEATTRVIPEAFAAGVPAIAFDAGGISEVIEDGVTGVQVRSVEAMAREAVALLSDGERRDSMARAARDAWERRFTKEKFQEQILGIMSECGAGARLAGENSATEPLPDGVPVARRGSFCTPRRFYAARRMAAESLQRIVGHASACPKAGLPPGGKLKHAPRTSLSKKSSIE